MRGAGAMNYLKTCRHKLLQGVVALLDGVPPLLLGGRVRLPPPLSVGLALLGVAVTVVVSARLHLIAGLTVAVTITAIVGRGHCRFR